jgi:hypothetical protein
MKEDGRDKWGVQGKLGYLCRGYHLAAFSSFPSTSQAGQSTSIFVMVKDFGDTLLHMCYVYRHQFSRKVSVNRDLGQIYF